MENLAPAFDEKPSSQIVVLTAHQARAHLKLRKKFGSIFSRLAMALFFGVLGLLFPLVWVLAVGLLLGSMFSMFGCMETVSEAASGKWKQTTCPNCKQLLNFHGLAFNCPFCTHRLMQNGQRAFDLT